MKRMILGEDCLRAVRTLMTSAEFELLNAHPDFGLVRMYIAYANAALEEFKRRLTQEEEQQ